VYATAKAKRDWFVKSFPKQAEQADQLLAAVDKRRSAVIRRCYQQEWCARGHYHMLLNSAMGFDAMIEATLGASGLQTAVPMGATRQIGRASESC
jgi:hypothetical protein